MKENRLVILLETFEVNDWKDYQKFAKSRYSDASDCKSIIDYIKKYKDRIDAEKMTPEYLRAKIRPDAKSIVFSNVISQLCKHIEAYFVWVEVNKDKMMKDTLLLKAFANRGLSKQFHKYKKVAKKNRDKMPLGLWAHYHEFMAEYLDYYRRMSTGISETKTILKDCDNYITQFSEDIRGYLGVEMHNREIILGEAWSTTLDDTFKTTYKISTKVNTSIYQLLKLLNEKKEWKIYHTLKNSLYNSLLSVEFKFTIISYLGSFLKWKNLNNDDKAAPELVVLYTYGLEKGILFPTNMIPLTAFSAIINLGSKTGNHLWAEGFINKYAHMVIDKDIDQIKTFGYAQLAYYQGDFSKTIELLRSKKISNFDLELKSKWLILISMYELGLCNNENYNYYINSLTSFIKRNQNGGKIDAIKTYLNSLRFLGRLVKKKDLSQLQIEIKLEKKTVHKKWFLEKIKGLQE